MLQKRLMGLFCLGGFQGAVGWWMVKSGLDKDIQDDLRGRVRVSPYRLSFHLVSAFLIYSLLVSTAFKLHPRISKSVLQKIMGPQSLTSMRLAWGITGLIGLTIFSGSLVAGNNAGLVYNEFPLMGGRLFPSDYCDPFLQPKWRNVFENSSLVQFDHRLLGMLSFGSVLGLWFYTRRLPPNVRFAANCLLGTVTFQASLGIMTLLYYVPVSLASAHQAGAMGLLTASMYFLHTVRSAAIISNPATAATAATTLAIIGVMVPYQEIDSCIENDGSKDDKKKG